MEKIFSPCCVSYKQVKMRVHGVYVTLHVLFEVFTFFFVNVMTRKY